MEEGKPFPKSILFDEGGRRVPPLRENPWPNTNEYFKIDEKTKNSFFSEWKANFKLTTNGCSIFEKLMKKSKLFATFVKISFSERMYVTWFFFLIKLFEIIYKINKDFQITEITFIA